MTTWAIGDVHGYSRHFNALLDYIPFSSTDTIVLLGDVIDRGPDSAGALEQIHKLRREHRVVFLRGNHEAMLLEARGSRESLPFWIECGGGETLDSYGARCFDDIPDADWELFERSRLYHETEDAIFVHANLDPTLAMPDQSESDLLWRFYDGDIAHATGKFVVCGHTIQRSGLPSFGESSICIDTLPESGVGWLTAISVEGRSYWQVDGEGNQRRDSFLSLR